jgi:hypothetical protein
MTLEKVLKVCERAFETVGVEFPEVSILCETCLMT